MAKLIKRDASGDQTADTQTAAKLEADGSLAPASNKRAAIIDRSTFEAKSEAVQIRERAKEQAEEILQAARDEAGKMQAEATEEAARLKRQAHAEGLQNGHSEGLQALAEAAMRTNQRIEQLQADLNPQIVQLAMGIAKRVLGRELEFHPEAVVEIVKHALSEKARQRREITLRVHPSDAQLIRDNRAGLLEMLSRSKEIIVQEDAEVAPHGVIIETEAGIIDAQLDVQLDALQRAMDNVAER